MEGRLTQPTTPELKADDAAFLREQALIFDPSGWRDRIERIADAIEALSRPAPSDAMLREALEEAREALVFCDGVMDEERDTLLESYTNLIGPDKGKVTDPDGKRWIAPFTKGLRLGRKAIARIDTALRASASQENG